MGQERHCRLPQNGAQRQMLRAADWDQISAAEWDFSFLLGHFLKHPMIIEKQFRKAGNSGGKTRSERNAQITELVN